MVKKVTQKLTGSELNGIIYKLLQQGSVKTQQEICQYVERLGLKINQARISRVLHKLGAVKMMEQDEMVYRLPPEILNIHSKNSLQQFVFEISHNETLIVINAAPGSAQLIARLLDHNKELGIIGTVAGDDTVIVVPQSVHDIQTLIKKITRLIDDSDYIQAS